MARPQSGERHSGILVVDKAPGITSFDVVAAARRATGIRRAGHAGTLDPDATGVLPLLFGEATKLMPYLVDQEKEYRATIRLGVATDTHDTSGRVVAALPVPPLSRAQVEDAARRFVGPIQQVPPMYSAVHHRGQRLYRLARAGVHVERTSREVVVHSITVDEVSHATATVTVVCGKGTYIRVLAADIGDALGCGGAVERLARLRVGGFGLPGSLPSASLAATSRGELLDRLAPPEAAIARWPCVRLDAGATIAFTHGQAVDLRLPGSAGRGFVRVADEDERFIGVGELLADGRRVRPERILHADRPGTSVLRG